LFVWFKYCSFGENIVRQALKFGQKTKQIPRYSHKRTSSTLLKFSQEEKETKQTKIFKISKIVFFEIILKTFQQTHEKLFFIFFSIFIFTHNTFCIKLQLKLD